MSSIGTGYDLAASTFSPDGKIFQVEYAQKAVDNSGTIVALAGKSGVVVAVDFSVSSKLIEAESQVRISNVNDLIGFTGAGPHPDCQSLLDYAQQEAAKHLKQYRELIPIKRLATSLAEYVHYFTTGISRPYGTGVFLTGWDENNSSIYLIEPSGLVYRYKAWSVGKNRQAAKTEIEKIADQLDSLDMDQLVKEAVRIILTVRDDGAAKQKNQRIDVGWVGVNTHGKHMSVDPKVVADAEQWVADKLAEEDAAMDD